MNNGINELSAQMPKVKRSRDFHLYDFDGRRYLDLCLDGGRAMLGHKAGKIVRDMKNGLEKGLAAGYPSVYPGRLLKQVKALHPGVSSISVVFAGSPGNFQVVRPFDGAELPGEVFELFLPMAGSSCLRILCAAAGAEEKLPRSDALPAYLLAGLCRAAAELASFDFSPAGRSWAAFDSPLWRREGPWLHSLVDGDAYPSLFKAFLDRGVVISPDAKSPSCAPSVFTQGEIKPIKDIEREFC